jgi:nitrous oxidase accessory protein
MELVRKRSVWLLAVLVSTIAILPAWGGRARNASPALTPPSIRPPARPATGLDLHPGDSLQAALDAASPGAVFRLAPGVYPGPVIIRHPVTLWGPSGAIIRSTGEGRTVLVESDNAAIEGLTVDGSGDRYDKTDSAVYVRGRNDTVRGVTIRNALYGIVIDSSEGLTVEDNHIVGNPATPLGIRGDAIRCWGVRNSLIAGNVIENSRDLIVWFSPRVRVVGNFVRNGRYGTHFMYSNGGVVEDNRYLNDVVGVFVMYSDDIRIARNLFAGNLESDGFGVGGKESGNLTLEDNRFIRDHVGVYFDTCPFHPNQTDRLLRNRFMFCDTAMVFLSSETNNEFEDNTLSDNLVQVRVESRGDLMRTRWRRNYFDDYRGYDLNGDGFGDVPYELRSLSGTLIESHPNLTFFRGTVALDALDTISEMFPLFKPRPLLVDPMPRMEPPAGSASARSSVHS